jgi:hypothetical protein
MTSNNVGVSHVLLGMVLCCLSSICTCTFALLQVQMLQPEQRPLNQTSHPYQCDGSVLLCGVSKHADLLMCGAYSSALHAFLLKYKIPQHMIYHNTLAYTVMSL